MTVNFGRLSEMSRDQLVELAGKQGLRVHPRAKEETIIKSILDSVTPQKPQVADMQHVAEKPKKPVYHNTRDDVEKAISSIKARQPKLDAEFNEEENTVHFRCLGAEDCVNLSIPMRIIVQKAQNVSRGRIALLSLNREFGDLGGVSPKNAYTNIVIG